MGRAPGGSPFQSTGEPHYSLTEDDKTADNLTQKN